ncbi:MAG: hypothetical protein IPL84_01605 [Chitinophagaceae bacterium]|nr:hypothetical protein [Chitinophagaceae bacterium]
MRKIVFILFLTTSFFSAAQAQKKFVYEDSSLLQQEEVYAPVEEAPVDTATHAADEVTTDEVEPPDTSLYLNNLYLPVDSIRKWKQLKEYDISTTSTVC